MIVEIVLYALWGLIVCLWIAIPVIAWRESKPKKVKTSKKASAQQRAQDQNDYIADLLAQSRMDVQAAQQALTDASPPRRRSAEQKDYSGSVEPDLVPGALRAYRHFRLDRRKGTLVLSGGTVDGSYHPDDRNPVKGTFQAACYRPNPFNEPLMDVERELRQLRERQDLDADLLEQAMKQNEELAAVLRDITSHESPHTSCECGFYASYDPQTDFYSRRWQYPFRLFEELQPHDTWIHAVVEMSGRVLMGSRGVRAEKMKVLAITLDRAKSEGIVTEKHTAEFTALAQGLGIPYYEDAEKMYADFPPQDVSHLIDETS